MRQLVDKKISDAVADWLMLFDPISSDGEVDFDVLRQKLNLPVSTEIGINSDSIVFYFPSEENIPDEKTHIKC